MRIDLDQLDRDALEEQRRERDRHREPCGRYRRSSPRSRSVEAQILDRVIAALADESDLSLRAIGTEAEQCQHLGLPRRVRFEVGADCA
jgi:hypothetical protein